MKSNLEKILRCDVWRWRAIEIVGALDLPDCWIGAGFVRSAVWDFLHARAPQSSFDDVDVIWHDPEAAPGVDAHIETLLGQCERNYPWSVKNQAHMHKRNNDPPYLDCNDALRFWPETATAVAVRLTEQKAFEILAPYGLDDLFALKLRPTRPFETKRREIFETRYVQKNWLKNWPLLALASPSTDVCFRL